MLTLALALYWARKIVARCSVFVLLFCCGEPLSQAADLSGRWEGCWQSCTDKFHGTVQAKITSCGNGRYEAVFTGRAFKVMPYRYKARLIASTDAETGVQHFKCSRKIPLWGCYWMHGTASEGDFFARYRTDDHTGYFKMHRVGARASGA